MDWAEFQMICWAAGYEPEAALEEKSLEIQGRRHLRLVPNQTVGNEVLDDYFHNLPGNPPTQAERQSVLRRDARSRISDSDQLRLLQQQNARCGLCGTALVRSTRPHVDHIVPVALGGSDDLSNLRVLCLECNLGKGAVLVWPLGVPWDGVEVTRRMRFCVLARDESRCTHDGCTRSWRDNQLFVVTLVPLFAGGRRIFDNLRTVCEDHRAQRDAELRARSRFVRASDSATSVRVGIMSMGASSAD